MTPPNSSVEILTPDVIVLGRGPLGALLNETDVLIKETPESSLPSPPGEHPAGRRPSMSRMELFQNLTVLVPGLQLPGSQIVRSRFLLFRLHSVYAVLLQPPEWAKTPRQKQVLLRATWR